METETVKIPKELYEKVARISKAPGYNSTVEETIESGIRLYVLDLEKIIEKDENEEIIELPAAMIEELKKHGNPEEIVIEATKKHLKEMIIARMKKNNEYPDKKYSDEELEQFDYQDPINILNYIRDIVWGAQSRKYIDEKACFMIDERITKVQEFIEAKRTDVMIELCGYIPDEEPEEEPKKEI